MARLVAYAFDNCDTTSRIGDMSRPCHILRPVLCGWRRYYTSYNINATTASLQTLVLALEELGEFPQLLTFFFLGRFYLGPNLTN